MGETSVGKMIDKSRYREGFSEQRRHELMTSGSAIVIDGTRNDWVFWNSLPPAALACGWRIRKNSIYRSIFMSREPEPSAKFSRWRA